MTSSVLYPSLLSPMTLAGRPVRNRSLHASMSTSFAQQGKVTPQLIQYYANRARGGTAVVVTEPVSVAPHQDLPNRIRAFDDHDLDGLKRWAAAVEVHDTRLVVQLMERGRGRNVPGRNYDAIGASALPDDLSWTMPHPLTTDEVRRLIDHFIDTAARLARCGFSGVELSAGHGHLLHQFLSPWSNHRSDAYGGDVENRTRMIREIVSGTRAGCPRDFIVGLKLPGDDGVPGGVDPREAARIAKRLTASREADYVCFAMGAHARSLEMHVPDGFGPRAPYVPLIRELKAATSGVPVVALGRITDPAEADAIIERGDAELVGLGRTLIADPAFVNKAAAGRAHDIRYCVSCNTCWERISPLRATLACDNNPRVAQPDETDYWPTPAGRRRRVVVVGAGIAGLEAAWVAAARGHDVTLFGATGEVGGKARLRALLPGGEGVSSIYDYQHAAAQRAGVRFELGRAVGQGDVLALEPDAVVLAAGSRMVPPHWLPEEILVSGFVPDLRTAAFDVLALAGRQPGTAVVYDMDHTDGTYAMVELLYQRFERVVVITPRDTVGAELPWVNRGGVLRRIAEKRIPVVTLAEPLWNDGFEDGVLTYRNVYNGDVGTVDEVAFLAWATPRTPNDELAAPLRAKGVEVRIVGDCQAARNVMAATSEGHAAGHAV